MGKSLLIFIFMVFALTLTSQEIDADTIYADTSYYYEDDYYEADETEEEKGSGYLGEINFVYDQPVGVMKKKFQKNFFGFDLGLYRQLNEDLPLFFGLSFFIKGYDSQTVGYFDYSLEDGLEYEFEEEFKGKMFGFDLSVKYFSDKSFWIFNPYIQMDFEYRRAYASITTVNLDLAETTNTDFEGGNSSLGYNVGVGSIIAVNSDKYYFNFRVSYSSGGGLFLYKRIENISSDYTKDYFEKKYFPLGFVTINLGFTFL